MPNAFFQILKSDIIQFGRFLDAIRGYKFYPLPKVSCIPRLLYSNAGFYFCMSLAASNLTGDKFSTKYINEVWKPLR